MEWRDHVSSLGCDEPEDVYNFIASSSAMQRSTPQQMQALRDVIARMFEEGGGVFKVGRRGRLLNVPTTAPLTQFTRLS